MGVRQCFVLGLVTGLVFGGILSTAQAAGWDYDLTINQAQSNLIFDITLATPIGGGSDSASSPVTGTIGANLAPPPGNFNGIQITDLNAALVNDLNFDIQLNFFVAFEGTINDGGLLMDATHGGPGPAVGVSSGAFSQTGNLASAYGLVAYDAGILGSGNADLSTEAPSAVDFLGTVTNTPTLITLTVPIDITFDVIQDTTDLGDARVHGSIVATTIPLKVGDSDGDHDVDLSDLSNLAGGYGQLTNISWGRGDFDSDGDVDLNDLSALATNYGAGEAQAFADFSALTAVPEPAAAGLFMGLFWVANRRRR